MDAERNFPFARDRLVECYLWSSGPYEPRDARCRIISTKVIAVLSTLDDLYDVYGTREELELFTRAVERSVLWNDITGRGSGFDHVSLDLPII